jgi:ATP-dependent helicase/nuclease subunit A
MFQGVPAAVVERALVHPLLQRARAAARRGECRRETPLTLRAQDGSLVDGVVDLAFREDGQWIVVDFKTDRELDKELAAYKRQVRVYAAAISAATGQMVSGVLMVV